jgi:hypothetical protein
MDNLEGSGSNNALISFLKYMFWQNINISMFYIEFCKIFSVQEANFSTFFTHQGYKCSPILTHQGLYCRAKL